MHDAKIVSKPLATHFKSCKDMFFKTWQEIDYMSKAPYSLVVKIFNIKWCGQGLVLQM